MPFIVFVKKLRECRLTRRGCAPDKDYLFIIEYASQFPDGFSPRTPKWILYIKSNVSEAVHRGDR